MDVCGKPGRCRKLRFVPHSVHITVLGLSGILCELRGSNDDPPQLEATPPFVTSSRSCESTKGKISAIVSVSRRSSIVTSIPSRPLTRVGTDPCWALTDKNDGVSLSFYDATWGYASCGGRLRYNDDEDDQQYSVDASTMEDGSTMVIMTHLRENPPPIYGIEQDDEEGDFPAGYYGFEPKALYISVGLVCGDEVIVVGASKIIVSGENERSPSGIPSDLVNDDIGKINSFTEPTQDTFQMPLKIDRIILKNAQIKKITIPPKTKNLEDEELEADLEHKQIKRMAIKRVKQFVKKLGGESYDSVKKKIVNGDENMCKIKTASFSFQSDSIPNRRFGFILRRDEENNNFADTIPKANINLRVRVNIPRKPLDPTMGHSSPEQTGTFRGPAECVAQSAVTALGPAAVVPEGYARRDGPIDTQELHENDLIPGDFTRSQSIDASTIASETDVFTELTFDRRFTRLGATPTVEESLTISFDENFNPEGERSFEECSSHNNEEYSVDSPYMEDGGNSLSSGLSDFLYGDNNFSMDSIDEETLASVMTKSLVNGSKAGFNVEEGVSACESKAGFNVEEGVSACESEASKNDIDQGLDYLVDVLEQFQGMVRQQEKEKIGPISISNRTQKSQYFARKKACFHLESEIKSKLAEAESVEVHLLEETLEEEPHDDNFLTQTLKSKHKPTMPPSPKALAKKLFHNVRLGKKLAHCSNSEGGVVSAPITPRKLLYKSTPVIADSPTDVVSMHLEELRKLTSLSDDVDEGIEEQQQSKEQSEYLGPIFCTRTKSSFSELACGAGSIR